MLPDELRASFEKILKKFKQQHHKIVRLEQELHETTEHAELLSNQKRYWRELADKYKKAHYIQHYTCTEKNCANQRWWAGSLKRRNLNKKKK